MTAECDKCGLVKRDVHVVEYSDGLRMICASCAPLVSQADDAEEEEDETQQ
jgi:hypothetical protein